MQITLDLSYILKSFDGVRVGKNHGFLQWFKTRLNQPTLDGVQLTSFLNYITKKNTITLMWLITYLRVSEE